MVGAHPSMPDTLDGYGILAQGSVCVDPGSITKNIRRVGTREVVYLPLNKPGRLYFRIKPSFLALCLVVSLLFIAMLNEKRSRGRGMWNKKSVAQWEGGMRGWYCVLLEKS